MLKKIPLKNYILLTVIIVVTIILVIYFYMWHNTYEKERMGTSIMNEHLTVIQYNELDSYLIENKDTVIYVSVLNDEKIRSFEKKFKRIINKYSINNDILYLNITNEVENKGLYQEISNKYGINVPYIIVFRNGEIVSKYNIKDNDYDIGLLEDYLIKEGIIND